MDEWTRAETGVGAAMAAGSHDENGIWALFVMVARMIIGITILVFVWALRWMRDQCL